MTYDRTLIVIRERSFLDLLDLALLVVRDRPVVLGLTALAGIAPFAALNLWLLATDLTPSGLWILLLLLETPWATAPLTVVLGDLMFGVRPRPRQDREDTRCLVPRALPHSVSRPRNLLSDSSSDIVLVPARFAFLSEVVLLERRGAFACLGTFASDQPRVSRASSSCAGLGRLPSD